MQEDCDISTLQQLVGRLRETAEELRRRGSSVPAVDRNASRILASVKMLEISCCDLEAPQETAFETDSGNGA
jgi:hypothetical protein